MTHLAEQHGNGSFVEYRGVILPTREQVEQVLMPMHTADSLHPIQLQMIEGIALTDRELTLTSLRRTLKEQDIEHRIV